MGQFTFIKTDIEDLYIIEPKVFGDNRGYFMETYNYNDFKAAGLDMVFVQDNQSRSKKGVLRGLHFQKKNPQGKLVRVIEGEVYDVAVDIRPGSKTYGKWHGFLVLSDVAEFVYKCTRFYDPTDEGALYYADPDIGIDWPIAEGMEILLSEKDKKNGAFKDLNR